jgi:hypothetical protein
MTMMVAPTQMANRALLLVVLEEHLRGRGHHLLLTASSTCRSGAAAASKDDIVVVGQSSYWCLLADAYPRRAVGLLPPFTSSSMLLLSLFGLLISWSMCIYIY